MSINHEEFIERVNASEGDLGSIVSELLTEFVSMEAEEVLETLRFIQSQVESGDISENPFHGLMEELGEDESLFKRMSEIISPKETETTTDDSSSS